MAMGFTETSHFCMVIRIMGRGKVLATWYTYSGTYHDIVVAVDQSTII